MAVKAKVKLDLLVFFSIILGVFLVFGFLKWGGGEEIEEFKIFKKDRAEEILEGLSLDQKIGQVILTGLEGEILVEKEVEMIKGASVSGFILLSKNIQSPEQVQKLTSDIQAAATTSATKELPILISVDQEGGSVTRIDFEGFEKTSQSQIESVEQAYQIGKKRGSELKSLGIDVNFSPVVEVLRDENSYLGQTGRHFANRGKGVLELASAMIKGMAESNVVAVAKHFPGGLGRIFLNPHDTLPEIDISREDLEQDLFPFRNLAGEVEAMMVTHLLYPQIDKENPVAISRIFIKDILRDELGFDGVIIVDDLKMGAVVKNYQPEDYAFKAILSGADLIIIIDRDLAERVRQRLRDEIKRGGLTEKRLDEAVERVLRLRFKVQDKAF